MVSGHQRAFSPMDDRIVSGVADIGVTRRSCQTAPKIAAFEFDTY
jgi:hypothetical protein